jgi:hypothetical protein
VYAKIGRRVVYRLGDLDAWISERLRQHTGATAA